MPTTRKTKEDILTDFNSLDAQIARNYKDFKSLSGQIIALKKSSKGTPPRTEKYRTYLFTAQNLLSVCQANSARISELTSAVKSHTELLLDEDWFAYSQVLKIFNYHKGNTTWNHTFEFPLACFKQSNTHTEASVQTLRNLCLAAISTDPVPGFELIKPTAPTLILPAETTRAETCESPLIDLTLLLTPQIAPVAMAAPQVELPYLKLAPIFDGSSTLRIDKFINIIEDYSKFGNLNDAQKKQFLLLRVSHDIRDILRQIPACSSTTSTWEEFKKPILERYLPTTSLEQVRLALYAAKQAPSETAYNYADRLAGLAYQIKQLLPADAVQAIAQLDKDIVGIFIQGIRTNRALLKTRAPETVAEALTYLKSIDSDGFPDASEAVAALGTKNAPDNFSDFKNDLMAALRDLSLVDRRSRSKERSEPSRRQVRFSSSERRPADRPERGRSREFIPRSERLHYNSPTRPQSPLAPRDQGPRSRSPYGRHSPADRPRNFGRENRFFGRNNGPNGVNAGYARRQNARATQWPRARAAPPQRYGPPRGSFRQNTYRGPNFRGQRPDYNNNYNNTTNYNNYNRQTRYDNYRPQRSYQGRDFQN